MPLTFPAHQGLILPAKLRWPERIDATALCAGAAAPDLAYPFGAWMNRQSHTAIGVTIWALPVAVVIAIVTRRWAASGIFACLPDLGPLQLRSYRVLSARRPALLHTVGSAAVGATSHVLIDGFTHAGRWGANWLGFNRFALDVPVRGSMSWARVLQYVGHGAGTLLFVVLLVVVSSSRLVSWYGVAAVADARSVNASLRQRLVFSVVAVGPVFLAVALSSRSGIQDVFLAQTVFVPSLLIAGIIISRSVSRQGEVTSSPERRSKIGGPGARRINTETTTTS